eukprot:674658-Amphidinium_carterae.1
MPVVGTQTAGGGFVGGGSHRPDHTGTLSMEWLEIAGELSARGIANAQGDTGPGAGAGSRSVSGFAMGMAAEGEQLSSCEKGLSND